MLRIAAETCRFLPATRVTDATAVLTLKTLVFEPLLRWVEGGRAAPALFSRWDISESGRRWVFHLRDGAVFHDGVACTSEHVLHTIQGILDSVDMFGMKWSYSRYLADAKLSAPTARSFVVENPEPFADILDILSEFFVAREDASGAAIIGTGPYRVEAFEQDSWAELRRVGDTPGPARIRFRAVPTPEARIAALVAGEADVGIQLEREARAPVERKLDWGKGLNTLSVMHYLNCFSGRSLTRWRGWR